MNELQQITDAFKAAQGRGDAVALASVVAVSGSAYRRPGARMLISDTGLRVGTVSGGCLERDVMRHAGRSISSAKTVLRLYDSLDEDLSEGFALGCNGAVLVMIEPTDAKVEHHMQFQADCLRQRRRGVIATVHGVPGTDANADCAPPSSVELGARVSLIEGGTLRVTGIAPGALREALCAAVADALVQGRGGSWSRTTETGTVSVLIELLTPPLRVMVFGAGQDVEPLVSFGHSLGWSMQVVANNGGFGTRARFPRADVVHLGSPADAVATLKPDGDTVVLLMSHNFPLDVAALCALAPLQPRYIGLLGPRHRAQRLLDEVSAHGVIVDDALRARIHGPVGLDIGAETPAEVALSIVAEINAVLRQRAGGCARLRAGPLHLAAGPDQHLRASHAPAQDLVCALTVHA